MLSEFQKFEIKGLKTFQGMEGKGFSGSLYYHGKRIATVVNEGSGGPTMLQFLSETARETVDGFLETEEASEIADKIHDRLEKIIGKPLKTKTDLTREELADELVDEHLYMKEVKKLIKRHGVVFIESEDDPDNMHYYTGIPANKWNKMLYNNTVNDIKKKNKNAVILNEKYSLYPFKE